MLKRLLLLAVLAVAGLALMAATPSNDNVIDGTAVDCAATYTTSDGTEVCLFYVETGGTDEPPVTQAQAAAEAPPAEVQDALSELPSGLLDHLPENVRAGFQAIIDGNGHLMSEITNCTTLVRPLRILPHRNISSSGSIYCAGSDVARVRYKLTIQRYGALGWWFIQGSPNDSGWRNGRYASAGLATSCESGIHTYRAYGVGVMEDTSGDVHYAEKYSSQRRTTCYIPD